jgi:hypothetical protein
MAEPRLEHRAGSRSTGAEPKEAELARRSSTAPSDPVPYEEASSTLTQLALPSAPAERSQAEAFVDAMEAAATAHREFFNAVEEHVDPGMNWALTERGDLFQFPEGNILDLTAVDGFPTKVGVRYVQTRTALREAATTLGLEECIGGAP